MAGRIFLKRGKDKPLIQRHPWIFSGAIERVEDAHDGETVEVLDAQGQWLARAQYNSRSQIAARVWTFEPEQLIDRAFFAARLERAYMLRKRVIPGLSDNAPNVAYRLVNAENDGLPGVIVDCYGAWTVVQALTLGAELHKTELVGALAELFGGQGIYERSDVDVRKREGLPPVTGVLHGPEPPDRIEVQEQDLRFWVDIRRGHKTGHYLDQRLNRERAAPYLQGETLNAFAYTGAFGVYAAAAASSRGQAEVARVTNLDSSVPLLELARENFALNGYAAQGEYVVADAFTQLRQYRTEGRRFDAIVLDPPKFVLTQAQMERALRAYKDLNLLSLQLLRPNGVLVTFSCSGLVSPDLFQKVVFGAQVDAHREAQIVEKLSQSPDHPIALAYPEGEYLKGLILRVL